MRASRLAALAITTAMAATACTSVNGKSDNGHNPSDREFHGIVVTSTCIDNGQRRRIQEISLPEGNVVRQHDFFLKADITTTAKCNSSLTGLEQRGAFNADFSQMLVVKTKGNTQQLGWLLDTKSSGKGNVFQPLISGAKKSSTMLPGAYDPKTKMVSYAQVNTTAKTYSILSGNGKIFKAVGNSQRIEGGHIEGVYLPNGSHQPRAITGDMTVRAAFEDYLKIGYAVKDNVLKLGKQDQVYGSASGAKIYRPKVTPIPVYADGGNSYTGYAGKTMYDVVTSTTGASVEKLVTAKGNIDSAAGNNRGIAYLAWNAAGTKLTLTVAENLPKSGMGKYYHELNVASYNKGSVPQLVETSTYFD